MLKVILIWLYVIVTVYLFGFAFLSSFAAFPGMPGHGDDSKRKGYVYRFRESYPVAGVVLVTVYAEIFSLFVGVGLLANLILIAVCIFIAVIYRNDIYRDLSEFFPSLFSNKNIIIYVAVFILMAYGTSHGIMHYDSDLYHAQAIHWIEDYGIIKGLGNLHVRLAYNSSAFPLSALYSFSFLGGQSYHAMAGFFALLLAWQCVDIINVFRRGHFYISDFARICAIYYLFTIYDEMVSPASDYFLSVMIFYIVILVLDMYSMHIRSYVPYILLALLGVYAITIKLSAAPMILLSVIPIYMIIKDGGKEKKAVLGISVVLSFLIALPFLIRNVIISGWLLYPVTFIDIFNVKWKIPKGVAQYDALEIATFGKGFNDVASYGDVKMSEWIPGWFGQLGSLNKILIVLCMVSVLVYLIYLIHVLCKKNAGTKAIDFIVISGTLILCLVFWFFSAPLIRYGIVYVLLTPAVILGKFIIDFFNSLSKDAGPVIIKAVRILFILWMAYKIVFVFIEDSARFNVQYLIAQQDYGNYETDTFFLGGEKYFYPVNGDQVGYYPFPSATHDVNGETTLIGEDLRDGFMPAKK